MYSLNPSRVSLALAVALSSTPLLAEEQAINDEPMEVIVVSGSKTEQNLFDVAGSISVMNAEEIERQMLTNMSQLFRYDPSINVTGNNGQAQNFIVRGMGGDRVLMIKDGMRMNEGYGADGANDIVGRGFIDLDTLKRVEVAKGAASSLYGSDALGGIVVFTTKDPSDYLNEGKNWYADAKTGYTGENSEYNIGSTLALRHDDFEHMLNISYRDGEETQNYDETRDELTVESTSALYKAVYNLDDNNQLKFTADYWKQDTDSALANTLAFHFRGLEPYGYVITDENAAGEKENSSFKLSYHSQAKTGWYDSLEVAMYNNNAKQLDDEYVQLDIDAPMFGQFGIRDMWTNNRYEQETYGLLSHATKSTTLSGLAHTFGFGVDLETTNSERVNEEYRIQNGEVILDTTTEKFPENDTLRTGLYVNDQIAFMDGDLMVTPGLRWDYYDMDPKGDEYESISESQLSANLGAIYKLGEQVSVYGQFSQGFKVPPYDQAYADHDNSLYGYKIIATDDLDPESSDTYELGLRGMTDRFAFSTAVFYSKYEDFITTALVDIEDDVLIYQYDNVDSVTIKGIETSLQFFATDNLTVYFSASYQDGKDDDTDEYVQTISPISGTLGLGYQEDNWGTDLYMRWARNMNKVNEGEAEIAGYGVVDLMGYYEFGDDLVINAGVTNLFDKEYIEFNSVAGAHADEDLSYHTEPGRNFTLQAKYRF